MKGKTLRKSVSVFGSSLMAALFAMTSIASANSPYFKVYGGDVWAGGWFANNCSVVGGSPNNPYQDPNYDPSATVPADYGGILTYAKNSGSSYVGASGQYGVFALGQVDGDGSSHGFFSDATVGTPTTSNHNLTFANSDPNYAWGGNFQYKLGPSNQVRQQHCIPDYYGKKPATATTLLSGFSGNPSSDTYSYVVANSTTPFDITAGAVTIDPGRSITLYVDGPAYIDHDITYNQTYDANSIPKFAVVVRGPLYIAPSVSRLDGLYIAEPKATDNASSVNGVIWTCHPNDTSTSLQSSWVGTNCDTKLTINGALIAAQVNFLRTHGDLASASLGEDPTNSNIAEVINYIPAMVIGGPFFSPQPSSTLPIESLVSLPPLY